MAAYAYRRLPDACLVETVQAHAGIDIGDTFIGMHLNRVAVPVRPSIRAIGAAHLTMAFGDEEGRRRRRIAQGSPMGRFRFGARTRSSASMQ